MKIVTNYTVKTTHTDQNYRIKKTCLQLQEWNRDKLQKNIVEADLERKYCVTALMLSSKK